ncbi:BLOC-3 complex member HPS1 [Eurosta solidaginis]|uniref:BLOC-3 complex member HPS1 n=1 Tax=Eurosta solidaginis TaxID=178769 RepID=UPI0035307850
MNGLIVFNSANDVVFQQLNKELADHFFAKNADLFPENATAASIDGNIILQIFSPIINSQRIMHCQFDNTYSSFQCDNGLNFTFGDLLGYTFVKIGQRPVDILKRHLGIAIALARHLYGANLFATQANSVQEELLSNCLESYEDHLWDEEEAMMIEALPRLLINHELNRVVRSALDSTLQRLRDLGHQRAHAILFASHKFVASVTSRQALALSPSDLVFLTLLTRSIERERRPLNRSVAVFLQGASHDSQSGCVPCIAQLSLLGKGVLLVQVIEYANLQVACSIYDTFFVLQKITSLQVQGDSDAMKPTYDSLESFIKQSLDALKRSKLKGDELDTSLKKFVSKWENLKKMYIDFFRTFEREILVRIESNIPAFMDELKQLFTLTCCDSSGIALDQLAELASFAEGKLLEVSEFLAVKAERNISIQAYLEDFPGLIHFVYVDRTTGLMIAPDLRANQLISKQRLWSMVEFTRNYLKKGHSTVTWKDKTFHYSYFLWFEDQSGGSMKSIDMQQHIVASASSNNAFKPQFEPGILAADYYQQLGEVCYPKATPGKVKCFELFCIHLGLVTATCAVEHARRLVATIADVAGDNN